MLIKKSKNIDSSEITDEWLYYNRRPFVCTFVSAMVGAAASGVYIFWLQGG